METSSELVDRLRDHLRHEAPKEIICVYLFGSYGRGTPRPDSDVDIAVLYCDDGVDKPLRALELASDLDRLLGKEVDVVDLRTAPVDLVHRVLRDGVLILDREPQARVRFEVDARNRYFDLQPILDEYRRTGARDRG